MAIMTISIFRPAAQALFAGLLLAVVFRMMMPLIRKRDLVGMVVLAAVFVAVGLLRLPLPAVLLVAIPLSIAITFAMRRRAAA